MINVHQEVHDLVYHGQGYSHADVWQMPVTFRRKYIKKINDYHEAIQAEKEKQQGVLTAERSTKESIEQIKKQYKENTKNTPHVHQAPKRERPGK